jgi:hypothetical protein
VRLQPPSLLLRETRRFFMVRQKLAVRLAAAYGAAHGFGIAVMEARR